MRTYVFPVKPISVNDAYIRNFGRRGHDRRLSDEAASLKKLVAHNMEIQDEEFYGKEKFTISDSEYYVSTEFSVFLPPEDFFYSKGFEPKAFDVSNVFKLIEDAMFEYMGINDKHVVAITGYKTTTNRLFGYEHINKPLVIVKIKREKYLLSVGEDAYATMNDKIEFINQHYSLFGAR